MKLVVNELIEWTDAGELRVDRILWISRDGKHVAVIDIDERKPKVMPVRIKYAELETAMLAGIVRLLGEISAATTDSMLTHESMNAGYGRLSMPESDLPAKHREMRDSAFEIISTIVAIKDGSIFSPGIRGRLIAEVSRRTNKSPKVIYKYLRRFWQRGQVKNALLPDYHRCGATEKQAGATKRGRPSNRMIRTGEPTGINVDAHILQLIKRGVEDFYLRREKMTYRRAYNLTMSAYFASGYETRGQVVVPILLPADQRPTYDQFRYWADHLTDPTNRLRRREGARKFSLRHRPILGDSTQMAFGPGSIFQIDATIADIHLVSWLNRNRIIGRPVLYFVIDVFSRCIVGFSVSLEGPSWVGAMQALENAAMDKVEFCREFGKEISESEWPCHHLPAELLADRGELEGYNADNLVNGLGIQVSNTPPYRADWKGIVERNFRLTNDRMTRWLPGAVRDVRERGGPDYRLDACLTLYEFRQLVIELILYHNSVHRMDWYPMDESMISDGVPPYPRDLWEWGIQNRSGALRVMDLDTLRLNLLPFTRRGASITRSGIEFQKLHYTCDSAQAEGWFVRAREKGRLKVDVVHDPRDVSNIYLVMGDRQQLLPCRLLEKDRQYRSCEWWDVLDYFGLRDVQKDQARSSDEQATAEFNATVAAIVEQAKQKTGDAQVVQSNAARTKGIAENRKEERAHEAESAAWTLVDGEVEPLHTQLSDEGIDGPEFRQEQGVYTPPPKNLDLIRAVRERKTGDK